MTQKFPPYFEKYFEQKFGEINSRLTEMQLCMEKYEVRVSCLETWKANIMGKIAVISVVVMLAVNFAVSWLRKKLDI